MTDLDLTIIIPTYNRAESLRRTLHGIKRCLRASIKAEVLVVDNCCTDHTPDVVREYATDMPVRLLVESRPGKNSALNRGLRESRLGNIILFTDDDIDPDAEWLQQVVATSHRWPDYHVFGGRIDIVWPDGCRIPPWALTYSVQEFGFTAQNLSADEGPYRAHHLPFGPNYWVRRQLIEDGRRFDENVGPSSAGRSLGDETIFLRRLQRDGYHPLYSPYPRVGHRILPFVLTRCGILRRARELGRGIPHDLGLPRRELLTRNATTWRLLRRLLLCRDYARFALSYLDPRETAGVLAGIRAMRDIGYNTEVLRMEMGTRACR